MKSAILVTTHNTLRPGGGGVQVCTTDYQSLLAQAGFQLHTVAFDPDQRPLTKLFRRLEKRPYLRMMPPTLVDDVAAAVEKFSARFVFFNLLDFPTLMPPLRAKFGDKVKFIHLSHGLDSTDICIDQQVKRSATDECNFDAAMSRRLGSKIICEADFRRYLDGVLCLSPLDAELECWLGVPRTAWFPRVIRETPLDCQPQNGRVGCVATLDHPPNYHGFVALFSALQKLNTPNLRFRLVGSPTAQGEELAARFAFVDYVGRLSDEELKTEAATWCAFVHPIFHYARGCSTKLAVALGWGLPVVTTVAGARGYEWDEKLLPLAATAGELAVMIANASDVAGFAARRERSLALAAKQPTAADVAQRMRAFLDSVDAAPGLV
jgi:glycosyltransferase involved in cell wall biosynthesis